MIKTNREINLEKKLNIAREALEYYAQQALKEIKE